MKRNIGDEGVYLHYLASRNPVDELNQHLEDYFINSPVTLDITKLPDIVCLKYLAYYLALSLNQFPDYGKINWHDDSWLKNAERIHRKLRNTLSQKLNITLNYLPWMLVDQAKIATDAGVILIASVANDYERNKDNILSCVVTKELALELLKSLSEFNFLFSERVEIFQLIDTPISSKEICAIKKKSPRKDVLTKALSEIILPALINEGHIPQGNIEFAKLCWEKLPDALKDIGCTDVRINLKGEQDNHTFDAKHENLDIPVRNFKAFRQRIVRLHPQFYSKI